MSGRLALIPLVAALALLAVGLSPAQPVAGSFEAVVKDDSGKPLVDAVVFLTPRDLASVSPRTAPETMDQQNKEFVPHVLPISVGTAVSFPNRDNIRHHVYSFAPAERFELPLYIGTPAAPVVFDKPGVVVLGCNIHDWMVGYIYVLPTPYFAKTGEDGTARLAEIPPGPYAARVWHPRLRGEPDKSGKPITIAAGEPGRAAFVVALKREWRLQQRPRYEGPQGG